MYENEVTCLSISSVQQAMQARWSIPGGSPWPANIIHIHQQFEVGRWGLAIEIVFRAGNHPCLWLCRRALCHSSCFAVWLLCHFPYDTWRGWKLYRNLCAVLLKMIDIGRLFIPLLVSLLVVVDISVLLHFFNGDTASISSRSTISTSGAEHRFLILYHAFLHKPFLKQLPIKLLDWRESFS